MSFFRAMSTLLRRITPQVIPFIPEMFFRFLRRPEVPVAEVPLEEVIIEASSPHHNKCCPEATMEEGRRTYEGGPYSRLKK